MGTRSLATIADTIAHRHPLLAITVYASLGVKRRLSVLSLLFRPCLCFNVQNLCFSRRFRAAQGRAAKSNSVPLRYGHFWDTDSGMPTYTPGGQGHISRIFHAHLAVVALPIDDYPLSIDTRRERLLGRRRKMGFHALFAGVYCTGIQAQLASGGKNGGGRPARGRRKMEVGDKGRQQNKRI
jgi:hypothetical protein